MRPLYADEAVTLFRGDALAVLRELPAGSVDAVITDPPYSSGGIYRGDRAHQGPRGKYPRPDARHGLADFDGDNRDQRGWGYWCALWLSECLRVIKPGGVVAMFCDWRQLPSAADALQAGGWVWRGVVTWVKAPGSYRPQVGRYAAQTEFVVWGSAGPMATMPGAACLPGHVVAAAPRTQRRHHLTEKPLDLLRALVRIVPAGAVVLDPFAGAATTGVAAIEEQRQFIGVEINETYAAIARDRLIAAASQRSLPVPPGEVARG